MDSYQEYFKHAKLLTELYATPKELKSLENVSLGVCREQRRASRRAWRRRSRRL